MLNLGHAIQLSASDLVGYLNCHHLTHLDTLVATGALAKPQLWDPSLETLWERGAAHERAYVEHLRARGSNVVAIEGIGVAPAQVEQTLAAMRAGAEVIVQGAFLRGSWSGRADVLIRVPLPSALGDWSYEVVDTKLARETKGGTVLQLCLYSDLLATAQGRQPEQMHVVIPGCGFEPVSYRVAAYAAYYRHVRTALEDSLKTQIPEATYPHPKEHCDICRWRSECDARRRRDDHLCLVAGISASQIGELNRHDVRTLADLARLPLPMPWKPERGLPQSYERTREQARVQWEARKAGKPIYETLPLAPQVGLQRLPQPSPGDIFLDLEADPFVGEEGLEFLFGYVTAHAKDAGRYVAEWAFSRSEERAAFERFVDFVMARWAQHPGMHIYHYAPYEPSALKRLMGRYASRENEIDRMLRASLFVDLYAIARQSIRASVESYSIKNLEPFYDFQRHVPLVEVRSALSKLQARLELNDAAAITEESKETVLHYNRDDCLSAQRLRDWLEKIRGELIAGGAAIPRPEAGDPEPTPELDERQRQVAALIERLTADVPADRSERTAEQQARWILAYSLDWHRRELKSAWWEFFRLADLTAEDLLEERFGIAGLEYVGAVGGTARAPVHRYRFPPQEVELRGGETLHLSGEQRLGTVDAISFEEGVIDIKKRGDTASVHPQAAFAHDLVRTDVIADALLRLGAHVAENGVAGAGAYQAARDLLLKLPPRLDGEPLQLPNETATQAAVRIATKLESGVLPIQGPPGAGKTFTAAQMICALVKAGKTVGVTANSHKVIRNLLDKVVELAHRTGIEVRCLQKVADKAEDVPGIRFETDNDKTLAAIGSCQVVAGTAWLWSRPEAIAVVDTLFVDEAAQMSLANVLAVSQACRALVLLGDPQQLEQPIQGSHPEGTDVSALQHVLDGAPTIGKSQGLFLEETWRLHPEICSFTSEMFYEGRLRCHAGLGGQQVRSEGCIRGAGLRFLPVPHEGNQNSSIEEAEAIQQLVEGTLASKATWIDREGQVRSVTLEDILIIAPYNSQVFEIQHRLPHARVGTVDKFQGQEAAIVLYSVTTSSHTDAPRGMEFLYSLNRLNVAVSRAKCLCVLVAAPAIFEPACTTPRQMALANAYCRYRELANALQITER
ncbi:TM0106 family RecB-like putative nuclease [Steroidobacter sp. S1-65]|uniref:TM0106 family RecB-like putative nuclease n=1 Tax=Steroidobacter gossypii TaxID=2805490 RepID=A0ABS1X603_9GAMM|nr:TM0106 family RecB-like putative nuclease [Steroidobacter gossypii]MBM0108657.1 TM0106 family RecB-like putative nuclease [Steroidobacter gossypii]